MARQGERKPNHAMTAALITGAAAAAATGAFWSARAIARRNVSGSGRMNPVMETAATACELAHGEAAAGDRRRTSSPGTD